MADLITLANAFTIKGSSAAKYYQDIMDAADVSAYDSLDLQFTVLACDQAAGINIDIITSMQNKNDDADNPASSWSSIAAKGYTTSFPAFGVLSTPISSAAHPMLRYVRFMITFNSASSTLATFTITGLARRGLRVG